MHKSVFQHVSFNMTLIVLLAATVGHRPLLSDFPQLIAVLAAPLQIRLNVFAIQEQFLQLWQQDPDSAAYNSPWGLRLEGHLDMAVLQAAVHLLAKRHLVRCTKQLQLHSVMDSFNFTSVSHETFSVGTHGRSSSVCMHSSR